MIEFYGEFIINGTARVRVPIGIARGNDFWCSLNTGKYLIACNIVYMGDDEFMQGGHTYRGIIKLPYGDETKNEAYQNIDVDKTYNLNVASQVIGQCKLRIQKDG